MRTGLFITCCLFIISGCKENNRIPGDIIPPKKMQAILWDMMRADEFLGDFVLPKDSGLDKRNESSRLYGQVFSIHHISKEQFGESFTFYKTHPALFKVIMDSLSRPVTATPTEMIKQPAPGAELADTIMPLRKRKALTAE